MAEFGEMSSKSTSKSSFAETESFFFKTTQILLYAFYCLPGTNNFFFTFFLNHVHNGHAYFNP